MTITSGQLAIHKAASITDVPGTNGGAIGAAVATGVKNNIFPDVTAQQRTAGATTLRKVFAKVNHPSNEGLANPGICLAETSSAGDHVLLAAGTNSDVQSGVSPSRYYGAALINGSFTAPGTTFQATFEHADTVSSIQVGDTVRIGGSNGYEVGTIATKTIVSGLAYTFVLSESTAAGYPNGHVSAILALGATMQASLTGYTKSSAQGTVTDTSIEVSGIGSIDQTITLTFTSATSYTAAGSVSGSLGSGNIAATFAPSNAAMGAPFITVPPSAWGGTWFAGDTVSLVIAGAHKGAWLKRIVPAGMATVANDTVKIAIIGETS